VDLNRIHADLRERRAGLPVAAILIAFDSDSQWLGQANLAELQNLVQRYRGSEDCWVELVPRARWMAFAAAHSVDEDLLRKLFALSGTLKMRDQAELLSVMGDQCRESGTNTFLALIGSVPKERLSAMITNGFPDLTKTITLLMNDSAYRSLPEGVSRRAMNRTVVELCEVMPPWASYIARRYEALGDRPSP
jgi:hypothetical protein